MARELIFDIFAIDRASEVFRRVGREVEATGGLFGKFGAAVGAGLGAAAVGVGAIAEQSIKAAADFDAQMLQIRTLAGDTTDDLGKMSAQVLELAGQTAQAPEALALSLYHVASVGLRGAEAIDVVRSAAKLATVSNSDLESTTNALTAAVASGIPGIQNMDEAMGALNATVGSGDMKMSDLNQALGSGLLTVVKGYGLSMNDVSAALATFGDNNIRGADAATMLRMSVQAMAVPVKGGDAILKALGVTTGQTDQALAKYGITGKQLATDMQNGGLNKAISDLHDHLDSAGVKGDQVGEILTAAFGKKAGPGVAVLLGQFDRLQQKYQVVDQQAHTFGSEWDATTKTSKFSFDSLNDSVKALEITIGETLGPSAKEAADNLTEILTTFRTGGWQAGWNDIAHRAYVALSDPSQPQAVRDMTATINGIITGYSANGWEGAWKDFHDRASRAIDSTNQDIGDSMSKSWDSIKETVGKDNDQLRDHIRQTWSDNADSIQNTIYKANDAIRDRMRERFGEMGSNAATQWGNITSTIAGAWDAIKSAVTGAVAWVLNRIGDLESGYGNMLESLSHVPGFGWAHDAAVQMQNAGIQAHDLASQLTQIPTSITVNVGMKVTGPSPAQIAAMAAGTAGPTGFATGGVNIPAGMHWVGEKGPELMYVPGGSNIYDAKTSQAMTQDAVQSMVQNALDNAGGGQQAPQVSVYVQAVPDGPWVRQQARVVMEQQNRELLAGAQ